MWLKIFRSAFKENTYQFCDQKKYIDLYLMKIQTSFETRKNIDQFCDQKNTDIYLMKIRTCFVIRKIYRSVFNENIDQFWIFLKRVLMIISRF